MATTTTSVIAETFDHIRTWESDRFRLEMYDTYQTRFGKSVLAYEFYHDDELIFSGRDYGPSPMHTIDGDESVAGLLAFLSLKPGDTDREYFDDYTPAQLAWARQYGEELACYVEELECVGGR
jgi:hypothetical protein